MASPVEIFCCYAREDQLLLRQLKTHLMPLQRQGLIKLWADTDISAGTEWEKEINKHLNTAQIILLLISPDFMNSDYCYSKEMTQAIERHDQGKARVIPIILRPVYWQGAPFSKLQALPTDAKAVTSRHWLHLDEAFFAVTEGLRDVVEDISKQPLSKTSEQMKKKPSNQPAHYDRILPVQSVDLEAIREQFHQAMVNLYHETYKAIHYKATQFYRMVNEYGGVETAHRLIAKESTEGFTKLWERGRLDLSVEALVLKPEFASLFDETERKKARDRLAEYRYKAPWDSQAT